MGARKKGTGSFLKVGCGIAGKLQLMLIYTGLLSFSAVEMAVSIISCASSKLFTTACNQINQFKPPIQKFIQSITESESDLEAGDGLKASELLREVGEADRVVEDPVGAVVVGVRPTDDADDGEVLAVGSGDGVDDAETADSEGDDAGAHATRAGVAVGGVAGVELVAAPDEVEGGLVDEVVEKGQVEVARDGEDVGDAHLDQTPGQVPAQRPGLDRWGPRAAAAPVHLGLGLFF